MNQPDGNKSAASKAVTSNAIASVLTGILAGIDMEDEAFLKQIEATQPELVSAVQKSLVGARLSDLDLTTLYPGKRLVRALVKRLAPSSPNVAELVLDYSFFENHFKFWIVEKEGTACSTDKTRYLLQEIYLHLVNNRVLNRTRVSDSEYWMTSQIFKTSDEVLSFFNALIRLKYGHPHAYLEQVERLRA